MTTHHHEPTQPSQSEIRYEAQVQRIYQTRDVEISWAPSRCIHFGACWNGSIEAFDPRRRPWVDPLAEPPARLDEIIAGCPTGARRLRWSDGRTPVSEPEPPISVVPQADGPLFVRGPVTITDRSGAVIEVSTRVALCRCGHSDHKPFCDDSHYRVGFESNDPHLDGAVNG